MATEPRPETSRRARSNRVAVVAALGANLAIALTKLVGHLLTGSSSMLAETFHSTADTADQILLLWGERRGSREPSAEHPFGFGRERYFWAFVVALVLFSGGGVFSLYEAYRKLSSPEPLHGVGWAIAIVVASAVFESLSLRTATRRVRGARTPRALLHFVRRSKDAELPVVILEDSGALVGLFFAFVGLVLTAVTGNPRFDALGSVAIGILLVTIAVTLAVEMKSLLIGESAAPGDVAAVREVLDSVPGIRHVARLRTSQLGPDSLVVAARVELSERLGLEEAIHVLDGAKARIRDRVPEARVIFLEPQVPSAHATPRDRRAP